MTSHPKRVEAALEQIKEKFWRHPALKAANDAIVLQAIRGGTRGYTGESGNVAVDTLIREVQEAVYAEVRGATNKTLNAILEDTLAADGFVGFKPEEWRACKVFAAIILHRVKNELGRLEGKGETP